MILSFRGSLTVSTDSNIDSRISGLVTSHQGVAHVTTGDVFQQSVVVTRTM